MNHHLSHSNLDDSSDITSTSFGTTSSSYHDDDDGATDQRSDKFDILSFMSVVSKVEARTAKEWAPFVLLSIHLGPWNSFFPSSPYRGNSFSVTLIPGDMFLRLTPVGLDSGPAGPVFPQLVAVKTPLLEKGDDKKKKNSHLFRSISKEYQILRSELLRRHDNVINAYGCCWQSLDVYDGLPIPCLILEGTELGDLAKFCQTHELTLRERLRMCIQITEGVQAIHAMGIIHGDLKPNNILVFQSKPDGYIAKIADFGEAIVLAENEPPFRRPAGTTLYSPPEYYNPVATFDENGLLKAEIFSLGVVLSSLVQGMHIIQEMKKKSDLESSKKEDGFASWLASLSGKDQESAQFTNHDETTDSAASWETDTSWRKNCPLADEQLWEVFLSLLDGTLAASPARRFKTDEEVLTLLRRMLTLNLRRTLMCRGEASTTPLDQLQLRNPQWTAQGSAQLMARWSKLLAMPMSVSKAELRKATGDDITISSRLDGQEVEAISLSCLMRHSRPNFSRDFRFIEKYTTGKRRKLHSTKRRMRLFRPFGQARDTRVLGEHKEFGKLVRHFTAVKLALYRRHRSLQLQAPLKLAENDGAIFKVTNDTNLFWLLPYSVKTLLEDFLLQEATVVSFNSSRQREAAFEYTSMVLNSGSLSAHRLGTALSVLIKSAQMGHVTAQSTFGRLHSIFELPSPISREVEIEWLFVAAKQGSLTAWRRLQEIDPPLTGSSLRRTPYNCLHPEADKAYKADIQRRVYSPDTAHVWHTFVQYCARTGDTRAFLHLISRVPVDCNVQNVFGETPLVVASRSGHAAMVDLLLDQHANPRIATNTGAIALHFLSAFNDEDIPRVTALLLQHGAELEKQSEQDLIYKSTFDSPFGTTGGTPLQWAVLAGNSCAIQTLVDRGADPFMEEVHAGADGYRGSPLMWATTFHQLHSLKIFLASPSTTKHQETRLKQRLKAMAQPILSVAIDINPGLRFREYLTNGKDFELNALRCVQMLIEHGADPTVYPRVPGNKDSHPINIAAFSGNKSILEFLWDYRDGLLRPTPEMWTTALQTAIFERHHSVFDFLIAHREHIATCLEADMSAVKKCLTLTTDEYFVLGCVRLILRPGTALRLKHLRDIFFRATATNNFKAAKLLFEHGVDLTARLEFGDNTILGELIQSSSAYPNTEEKVAFLLSLPKTPDKLFWNVTYLDGYGLTALQTLVSTTKGGGMMNWSILEMILERFGKERYLNAKIKGPASEQYTGWTALHLAAYYGNFEAVKKIAQEPEMLLNPRSSHDETPVDLCIKRELSFAKQSVWEPDDAGNPEMRNRYLGIMQHLLSKGGQVSKYASIVRMLANTSTNAIDGVLGAVQYLCSEVKKRESKKVKLVAMCLEGDAIGALREGISTPDW